MTTMAWRDLTITGKRGAMADGLKAGIIGIKTEHRNEPQGIRGVFWDTIQNRAGMGAGAPEDAGLFAAIDGIQDSNGSNAE